MSKIINNLQYKEFFTEQNNPDELNTENSNIENSNNENSNEDSNTEESNNQENNEDGTNNEENANDETKDSNTIDNNLNKNIDITDESLDEVDNDDLDAGDDPDENDLNDSLNADEEDDDELTLDDMMFNYSRSDEIDQDIFVKKKIKKYDGIDLDEKLTELDLNDDDSDDNLFTQGGSRGQAAIDKVSQMQEDGDELASLILSVPIDFINLIFDTIIKLIGATFEKPINKTDEYLEPIRQALNGLYLLIQPIIQLADNIIGLPFSIGSLLYSVICNILKSFGVNMQCRTNYKVNHLIMEIYDSITVLNPFKLKDFFFNEDFRAIFIKGIRDLGMKILETIVLIIKTINTITKIIEYLINLMKKIIELIEQVTVPENLQNFLVVIITIGIFYITFFGLNKYLSIFS
jgi:hypothetical protein